MISPKVFDMTDNLCAARARAWELQQFAAQLPDQMPALQPGEEILSKAEERMLDRCQELDERIYQLHREIGCLKEGGEAYDSRKLSIQDLMVFPFMRIGMICKQRLEPVVAQLTREVRSLDQGSSELQRLSLQKRIAQLLTRPEVRFGYEHRPVLWRLASELGIR